MGSKRPQARALQHQTAEAMKVIAVHDGGLSGETYDLLSLRGSGVSLRRTLCLEPCESRMDAGAQSLLVGNLSQQRR